MNRRFVLFALLSLLAAEPGWALDKKLECLGVTFHVVARNGLLSIVPGGLVNNSPLQLAASGEVSRSVALDLDDDGSPELYLFFREKGASDRGHVMAFGTNGRRALSRIKIPALTPAQLSGYLGHDEFTFMEGCFMWRFALPDQKVRQIQYRLRFEPTGWELEPQRTVEF